MRPPIQIGNIKGLSILEYVRRFSLAIVAIALTTGALSLAPPLHQRDLIDLYLLPIVACTLFLGTAAGIAAAAVSAVVIDYFFTEPLHRLVPIEFPEAIHLLVFTVVALIISWLLTARRRAESNLHRLQTERAVATAAEKLREGILATMSHELRTPLTTILGFAVLMHEAKKTGEPTDTFASVIRRNGQKMVRLIDQLLAFGPLDADVVDVSVAPLETQRVLAQIGETLGDAARAKGLSFELSIDGPLPQWITTDAERLIGIVEEVAGNSVKFTQHGFVHINVSMRARDLVFKIEDTGIGIGAETRAKLFKPFSQADSSYTRRFGGMGIGLAWSRVIAQRLGGDVELLRTDIGAGSTLEVRIRATPLAT